MPSLSPRKSVSPPQSVCSDPCRLHSRTVSSAPGFKVFEITCAFTFVAPDDLLTTPWMALSIDSMRFVSSTHAIQLQGSDFYPSESIPHWYISLLLNILSGSFLPSLWSIDKPSLLGSESRRCYAIMLAPKAPRRSC